MAEKTIDFSRFTRSADEPEVSRQGPAPQLRARIEIERSPTYHQVRAERENYSNWSGGVFGGRVDRSR
jgi:hypothetical protein